MVAGKHTVAGHVAEALIKPPISLKSDLSTFACYLRLSA